MPKHLPHAFVRIVWRDAEDFGPTWASEQEAKAFADQDCLVESHGYLMRKTKQFVVLAADRTLSGNNPGEVGRICKIPVKWIVSTTVIYDTPPAHPLPVAAPSASPD